MFADLSSLAEAVKSALEINVVQMAVQIVATIILVVIVRYTFWNKITAFLEKRRELVASEIESAKQQNEEAARLQELAKLESIELKKHSKELLESSVFKAEEEHRVIVENAKTEAKNLMESAYLEIEAEKAKARLDLKGEVVELAALMAEKIIQSEIDDSKYKDLSIDDFESSEKA